MRGLPVQAPSNPERSLWHLPCQIIQPNTDIYQSAKQKKEAISTLPSNWVKNPIWGQMKGECLRIPTDQGMPTRKRNNVLITEAHVGDKYISQMVRTWNFDERKRNFSQEIKGLVYNRYFHSNEFFCQCKWW